MSFYSRILAVAGIKSAAAKKKKTTKKSPKKTPKKSPKKTTKKTTPSVEDAFYALRTCLHSDLGKGTGSREMRLLDRIKYALEVEGYKLTTSTNEPGSMPKTPSRLSSSTHFVASGGMCTLIRGSAPEGLDINAVVSLSDLFRSKQCYKCTIDPSDNTNSRSRGANMALPKPVTWHKLQKYGLSVENVLDDEGKVLLKKYTIEGVSSYTVDSHTFFMSNKEKCRRWMDGLDRSISNYLEK